jgi:serine kinase of HPr protein (carbohydrate metabolism regulator)
LENRNLHATALVLGDRGVLITGRSGAGKTDLALTLIEEFRTRGRFAALVADDQVLVRVQGTKPIAEAPEAIAGLVEIYGQGPVRNAWEPRAIVDLTVRLVAAAAAPRFQETDVEEIAGINVPLLRLSEQNSSSAARAILAWLLT